MYRYEQPKRRHGMGCETREKSGVQPARVIFRCENHLCVLDDHLSRCVCVCLWCPTEANQETTTWLFFSSWRASLAGGRRTDIQMNIILVHNIGEFTYITQRSVTYTRISHSKDVPCMVFFFKPRISFHLNSQIVLFGKLTAHTFGVGVIAVAYTAIMSAKSHTYYIGRRGAHKSSTTFMLTMNLINGEHVYSMIHA